jgi:hypothetical protein
MMARVLAGNLRRNRARTAPADRPAVPVITEAAISETAK